MDQNLVEISEELYYDLATFDFGVGTPYNVKMASKMLTSHRKNHKRQKS